ncbi:bacteriophage gp37 domain protein (plasmid) [Burkholderia cepacia]|nr:bacteriophage gp37 domain protein [Burkholderia cepacia]
MTKRTPVKVLRQDGSEVSVAAIGKSKAGRTLAGKHWDQFPASAS